MCIYVYALENINSLLEIYYWKIKYKKKKKKS